MNTYVVVDDFSYEYGFYATLIEAEEAAWLLATDNPGMQFGVYDMSTNDVNPVSIATTE